MDPSDGEEVCETKKAKSAQPTATMEALREVLVESDLNELPASHAQF